MNLSELPPGKSGVIRDMKNEGAMRRRLQDIGMIEGTRVSCLQKSPLSDPTAYLVRGAVIALRQKDARKITVEETVWD